MPTLYEMDVKIIVECADEPEEILPLVQAVENVLTGLGIRDDRFKGYAIIEDASVEEWDEQIEDQDG